MFLSKVQSRYKVVYDQFLYLFGNTNGNINGSSRETNKSQINTMMKHR